MAVLTVDGDIISNDMQEIYEWFGISGTSPRKVREALDSKPDGENLIIQINSPGGLVSAGQEIYSMLRERNDIEIQITGMACSSASIIAMAGPCYMSEPAMMMIHNVSSYADGDYHEMERTAETLKEINKALANAYVAKTGKELKEVLKMMDSETWIPAKEAIEQGFADGYITREDTAVNAFGSGLSITKDQIKAFQEAKAKEREDNERKESLLNDLYKYGI